jgi:hypothetical protein
MIYIQSATLKGPHMSQFCTTARQCQSSVCTNKVASGMRGPGSRNSAAAACHGGSRLPAVLAVATLAATYKPPEPSTPAGAGAAQDLRSGPGPIGGEWPDPFQKATRTVPPALRLRDCSSCRCNRRCIVVTFKLMSAIIIPAANHPRQGRNLAILSTSESAADAAGISAGLGPPHFRLGAGSRMRGNCGPNLRSEHA